MLASQNGRTDQRIQGEGKEIFMKKGEITTGKWKTHRGKQSISFNLLYCVYRTFPEKGNWDLLKKWYHLMLYRMIIKSTRSWSVRVSLFTRSGREKYVMMIGVFSFRG